MTEYLLGTFRVMQSYSGEGPSCYYSLYRHRILEDRVIKEINSYDCVLHESLTEIFRENSLSNGQIEELLRNQNSIIKPILELSPHFSKEVLGKLSLLWIAVLGGYQKSAELLVRSGADVNELFGSRDPQVADEKWTILHALVQMDPSPENERLIHLVTDHGADLQARDSFGRNVLCFAVTKDRFKLVKWFLEKGVEVNVVDKDGMTPLLHAAKSCSVEELLPSLMEHGADVTAKDKFGFNALHYLSEFPSVTQEHAVELARLLMEKGVPLDDGTHPDQFLPIHLAAMHKKNELEKLFLDHGADVNVRAAREDIFPLYLAAKYNGDTATLQTLLKRGADVDLRTKKGHTALHGACEMHQDESIRLLLSAGANVLIEDDEGNTPFAQIHSKQIENPSVVLMIKALALKKVCQPSIKVKDERRMKASPKLWSYYRDCVVHLSRMKLTRIIWSCTFLDLLTECQCRISALMLNPDFEANFELYDLAGFSMYSEDILRAFKHARKHHHFMLKQEDALYEADLHYVLPEEVIKKVVSYIFPCSKSFE